MTAAASLAGRQQRLAADGRSSVWVAASAGTGKTKVLTDRVLNLLLNGTPPGRILCLTFTRAAAAEMANRVNERLGYWAVAAEDELAGEIRTLVDALPERPLIERARRLFAQVLDVPGGMKIATIHAFCQSLLRRFPIEAELAPHFEVIDDRSAGELLAEAREGVLARARAGGAPGLAAALAEITRYLGEESFAELLDGLMAERTRLRRAAAPGGAEFRARLQALLGVPPGATSDAVLAAACAEAACERTVLRRAAACLVASPAITDRERGALIAAWLEDLADRRAGFADYATAFLDQDGLVRRRLATKQAGLPAELAAALVREGQRLAQVLAERRACAVLQATAALTQLAEALLAEYDRLKRLEARLDYEDLVLRTGELLTRPGIAPWVLFKLDGGIDHILVDEAQDTNPEQWAIVAALAEEFFAGAGARALDRTIFAVGDSKQSIYSFQRADPDAFQRMRVHFRERVTAAGERPGGIPWRDVALDVSFRSTEAVLASIDAVFALPEARDGVAPDGAPIRHSAERRGQAGRVELWPAVAPDAAAAAAPWETPIAQRRTREPQLRLAQAIAAQIRRWLDAGERLPARDRSIRPGDVMVLVRRRTGFVTALVRALKERDVPVAGVDRMVLTDQLVIEDLVALGQFLLLPEDDLTLAALLKSPLFGIDETTLFVLAHGRGERSLWDELRRRAAGSEDEDNAALRRAAVELSELLARADFAAPYELYADVLAGRGGRRAMLGRLGPDAGDPLDEFLALALDYERTHIPSLHGFLHWLAMGTVEVKRDLDQRGRDEVRVMTVHGAKGLQAPIVFLPDTLQAPNRGPRLLWTEEGLPLWVPRRDLDVPAAAAARHLSAERRDREYRRLLYVAMTRAEDRLYVCGWHNRRQAAPGCWYNLVAAGLRMIAEPFAFEADPAGADGWIGDGLRVDGRQSAAVRPDLRQTEGWVVPSELPGWARAAPPPEPAPPMPLAPSRPGIAEPAARSPLAQAADAGGGFGRGLLVHRLLQILPELPAEARRAAAARFLARPVHGLGPDEQAELAREILEILDNPDFAALFGPNSQAEVPVIGLLGDYALSGQIDRLVVEASEVLIVDYKTLRPPPFAEADIPAAYLRQLAAYQAVVERVYPGRAVRCALLWTDGPRLMPVSRSLLSRWAPGGHRPDATGPAGSRP